MSFNQGPVEPQPNPYTHGTNNGPPNFPLPYQPAPPIPESGSGQFGKSKIAAGVLGILIGSLGIHNFYLGKTGRGVLQLCISVISLGFLSPISAIWGLVEGVLIIASKPGDKWHKDGEGRELQD